MSKTIDERVVEMRFDNKQFESNVATSMSTLDKLKQKLNFSGASKGLEEVNHAAGKVNMSGLGGAVDSVKMKFSALEVIGVTALANITNSAVNAGKQLVSSLSIDQVTAGWQKFSDKTTSVATLVAQGNAIEDVNDQLDRLNWFTDETSYNFTEMVSNIAKFTATGKGLNESVTAMEGIATWAALSGQNAQTASRAMYQLSQAMGAGVMRLEDYKSIQNASMDTEEFRQKCLDAGVALGTLKKNGDDSYTSLVEGASGSSFKIAQFANNLTKEMWLTSDVMMKVFNDYSSAVEGIYNAAEEKGMLASEVIDEIYDVAEKKGISTDEAIKSLGYNFDSFALKAFEAAQKARTFRDAIDSVKDAVSTGWMKTFELIFGDAEKATELWTDLANTLWDVFAAGGETRNQILQYALDFSKPWQAINDKLDSGVFGKIKKVADTVDNVGEKVKKATGSLEYFQDIVTKVWRGDYGNHDANPLIDRFTLLEQAGYDHRVVQELVNKGYEYKLTVEDVEAAHKKFGLTMETTTEETKKTVKTTNEATTAFGKLSDKQLEQAGLTEDEIELYRALEKEADRLGISVSELADEMSKNDGRTLLIESFKNALDGLLGIGKAIKSAFADIFNPPGVAEMAVKLYGLIKRFNEFSEKLRLTDKETGELNATGQKLQRTFKGVFAIVDMLATVVGGALKIAFKVVSEVLSYFDLSILDITAAIGDAIVKFHDWFDSIFDLSGVLDVVVPIIKNVIKAVRDWFAVFKETPAVQKFIDALEGLRDAFKKLFNGEIDLSQFAMSLGENLAKVLKSLPGIAIQLGKDFIAGFQNGLGDGIAEVIKKVLSFCGNFIKSFASALGIHSPSVIAYEYGTNWCQGFINGVQAMLQPVLDAMQPIIDGVKKIFSSFWKYITDESGDIQWDKIIAGGLAIETLLILKTFATSFEKIANSLTSFSSIFSGVTNVLNHFSKVLDGIAWDLKAKALLKMAISIGILVAAIWVLAQIDDVGKLWNAVGVIVVLSGILIGLAWAMNALGKATVRVNKEGASIDGIKNGLLQIGIAMLLLAAVVKIIGSMKPDEASRGFKALTAMAVGLVVFMAALGGITRYAGNVDGIGKMVKKLAVAMLLMVLVCKLAGKLSIEEMLKGAAFAAAFAIFVMAITAVAKSAGNNVGKVGSMVIKLAIAMALLVGVCKLVNKLSPEEMIKGAAFAAAFVIFIRFLVAVTKIGKKQQIAKIGGLVLSVSVALLMMVAVCKLVDKLSLGSILKGVAFVLGFALLLRAMISILKIGSEEKIAKVSGSILAMSTAIMLMAATAAVLGMIDLPDLIKGVAAVAILGSVVALMAHSLKGVNNVKGSLMTMAVTIALLAACIVALSMIDDKSSLYSAVASLSIVMGMFILMIRSLKQIEKGKVSTGSLVALAGIIAILGGIIFLLASEVDDPKKAISAAASLGLVMLSMAVLLKLINGIKIDGKNAIKGILALTGLAGSMWVFAQVLKSMNGIETCTKTVITLTLLMTAMLGLLELLNLMDVKGKKAAKGIVALTAMAIPLWAFVQVLKDMNGVETCTKTIITLVLLMTAMTGLLELLNIMNVKGKKAAKGIIALTAMAIPLWAFVQVLKDMDGVKTCTKTVVTLVLLMTAMVGLVKLIEILNVSLGKALIGMAALALMGLVLREFVWVLSSMDGLENARENTLSLVILAGACTAMIAILSLIGVGAVMALVGVVALAALGLVLREFVWVLSSMDGLENARENAISLTILAGACVIMLAVLTLVGAGIVTAILGIASLALLGLVLREFVWVLSTMNGVENAEANAQILIKIMTTMADVLVKISLLGPLAIVGIAAVAGLLILVGVVGVLAVAIGALMEEFPGIQKFLDVGLPLLEQLAGSIGTMIGNFIGNLGEALSGSLVKIGQDIAMFMAQLNIASQFASGISGDAFEGVEKLMGILLKIGGTSIGTGIMDFFSNLLSGESSMEKFETDGKAFFEAMKAIGEAASDCTIDASAIDPVMSVAERLIALQNQLEPAGGIFDWFTGWDDIGTFGQNAARFLLNMANAFMSMTGVTCDSQTIGQIISVATRLVDLQNELQPVGGVKAWFSGWDDIGTFGRNAVRFLLNMANAFSAISGVTCDSQTIAQIFSVAERLVDLQNQLEPVGGITSWFNGWDDIGTFGQNAAKFLVNMSLAFSLIGESTVNSQAIAQIISVAERLVDLQNKLEPVGGVKAWFTGWDDIGTFGENAADFLSEMSTAFATIGETSVNSQAIAQIISVATRLVNLQNNLESVGGVVDWFTGWDDIGTFGENAAEFLTTMSNAFATIGDTPVNSQAIAQIISVATRLINLQNNLESVGGVVDWFTGWDDIATFGENAAEFLTSMTNAFKTIGEEPVKAESIKQIIDVAKQLLTLQSKLEPVGGVVDWFTGWDDIETFGEDAAGFLTAMSNAFASIGDEPINSQVIAQMVSVANRLVELQKVLPEEHWFDGKMDLSEFSDYICDFSIAMSDFSAKAAGIKPDAVDSVINTAHSIKRLIASLADLDTSGIETFTGVGTGGIGADGAAYKIAQAIAAFSEKVADIDTEAVPIAVSAARQLKTLIASLSGLDTSGIENFKPGAIGTQMKAYSDKVTGLDTVAVASSIASANRLKTFISSLTGLDTSGIANFKLGSIGTSLKTYATSISGVNFSAILASVSVATRLKSFITSLDGIGTTGAASFKKAINELSTANIGALVKAFSGASTKLESAGSNMINGLIKGIQSKLPAVMSVSNNVISSVGKGLSAKTAMFMTTGHEIMAKLSNGILSMQSKPASAIISCLSTTVFKIQSQYGSFFSAGSYLVTGFANGITANTFKATAAAAAMAEAAKKAAKENLGIHSPSKVFEEIGSRIPEGFTIGIGDHQLELKKAVTDMTSTATDTAENEMNKFDGIYLGFGSVGEDVKSLQRDLESLGHSVGKCGIDGIIGPDTTQAIREFQKEAGIAIDGVAGPETLTALEKAKKDIDNIGNSTESSISKIAKNLLGEDSVDKFKTYGKNIGDSIISGVTGKESDATSSGDELADNLLTGIDSNGLDMQDAGKNLGEGLITGIESMYGDVYDSGYTLGQKAVEGEKDGQNSHSPSKETIKAGRWLGEGLIIGIKHMGKSVYDASKNMGQNAVNATRAAMSTVLDALSADMDAQPTIRPVVDLSDVQTGVDAIHGLMSTTQTIGVRTNLNAIGTTMNAKLQNGSNDDIISAINKLGTGLEKNRGDTYNFGGFTYDDGSNISDAVQTLVRAARIGRRV